MDGVGVGIKVRVRVRARVRVRVRARVRARARVRIGLRSLRAIGTYNIQMDLHELVPPLLGDEAELDAPSGDMGRYGEIWGDE